jgi:hypothetical protein
MKNQRIAGTRGHTTSSRVPELFPRIWLAILAILLCLLTGPSAATEPKARNVLILSTAAEYRQWFLSLIEPSIRARVPGPINFYDAYLDDPEVEEKSYRESQAETFRRRYAGVKLDLVIACNPAGLQFATQYRGKIFPGVPIVFVGVDERDVAEQPTWQG